MPEKTYLATCPSCGKANRIPAHREGLQGRCGQCKSLLPALYIHPQTLDEDTFDRFVSGYPGPILAEFWAPW